MPVARLWSWIRQGLLLAAITAALFVLVEGLASVLLALREARLGEWWEARPHYYSADPERRHARYDEELGWVSLPNLDLADLYGPGRYLRTEARGFRSDHRISDRVLPGKARAVCSGDSFTFGQGVANDDTWCHLLSVVDPRLEMKNRRHKGYGKPVLRLRRGVLEVTNVPAPPPGLEGPGAPVDRGRHPGGRARGALDPGRAQPRQGECAGGRLPAGAVGALGHGLPVAAVAGRGGAGRRADAGRSDSGHETPRRRRCRRAVHPRRRATTRTRAATIPSAGTRGSPRPSTGA